MSHYFYITPEEYKVAEANGIDAHNLERRIRSLGWDKEMSLTKPLEIKTNRRKWAEVALSNGIKYYTFMSRVNNYGMSEEEAANKPLQDKSECIKRLADNNRKIPKELVQIAESNGIKYHTLRARLKRGMDPHEAATKKLMTNVEIGQLGARRRNEIHGNFNELIFKKKQVQ